MPELPEVETTMRGIAPHITGHEITNVIVRNAQLRWPIPKNIKSLLIGQTIDTITRRAKYLLLNTQHGTVILHLGMSGHLRVLTQDIPAKKHDHIELQFANQKILRLNDPRRFGAFLWTNDDPSQHRLLKDLGIEPLTKQYTGKYLFEQAQNKKIPVKAFLMDNKIVTGIGNIYATEALFTAKIHPMTPAGQVSLPAYTELAKASKAILTAAIKRGGTTLKDFSNSDGKPGYFTNELQVYGRSGLPCNDCGGLLESIKIGQRSSVFCSHCQCI